MATTPWTDPDPHPGDFDAELDRASSDQIEVREGNPDAKVSILVSPTRREGSRSGFV